MCERMVLKHRYQSLPLIKFQDWQAEGLQYYKKIGFSKGVYLRNMRNFQGSFFVEHLVTTYEIALFFFSISWTMMFTV